MSTVVYFWKFGELRLRIVESTLVVFRFLEMFIGLAEKKEEKKKKKNIPQLATLKEIICLQKKKNFGTKLLTPCMYTIV